MGSKRGEPSKTEGGSRRGAPAPRVVLLVGTGLIGGSFGMALRSLRRGPLVLGFDTDRGSARRAAEVGAVDAFLDRLEEGVGRADLVVLAVPPEQVPECAASVARHLKPRTVLHDVASVKEWVVRQVELAAPGARYVGGHPVAGREMGGIDAASPDLFRGRPYALCPSRQSDPESIALVTRVVRLLGAHPVMMDARTHDVVVGLTSHLPFLLAAALVRTAASWPPGQPQGLAFALAGPAFLDVTRVAASPADLWTEILSRNAEGVRAAATALEATVKEMLTLLEQRTGLTEELKRAGEARRRLVAGRGRARVVAVVLPDRPGALAAAMGAVAARGVNLADVWVSPPAAGVGVARLVVSGARAAREAARALSDLGLSVTLEG